MKNPTVARKLGGFLLFGVIIGAAIACSPNNPKKQPPPEKALSVEVNPGGVEVATDSKVDILFVIDDSQSMKKHQENVSNQIKLFVKEFEKNALIDFHFGVTGAFDSRLEDDFDELKRKDPRQANRVIDMTPLGELLPPLDADTGKPLEGPRFISRETPNFVKVLERTLLVGAKPGPDQVEKPTIGPWKEEFFSQVSSILNSSKTETVNKGFYRPEAFLAVFFITDANDNSPKMDQHDMHKFLTDLKNKDLKRVQAYAAVIPSNSPSCGRDSAGKPTKIEGLLKLFDSKSERILNLCSQTFGTKLAQFGRDIVEMLPEKVVELKDIPNNGEVKVYYGKTLLVQGIHYIHYPQTNTSPNRIAILRNWKDIEYEKDAQIHIEFDGVRAENIQNGRTKEI